MHYYIFIQLATDGGLYVNEYEWNILFSVTAFFIYKQLCIQYLHQRRLLGSEAFVTGPFDNGVRTWAISILKMGQNSGNHYEVYK